MTSKTMAKTKDENPNTPPPKGWLVAISISMSFISLVERDFISLKKNKLDYDPKKELRKIQNCFDNKEILDFIKKTFLLGFHCSIFYFLPFWVMCFPISFFYNFVKQIVFISRILDQTLFVNYRLLFKKRIVFIFKILQNSAIQKGLWAALFCLFANTLFRQTNKFCPNVVRINLPGFYGIYPKMKYVTFRAMRAKEIVDSETTLDFKETEETEEKVDNFFFREGTDYEEVVDKGIDGLQNRFLEYSRESTKRNMEKKIPFIRGFQTIKKNQFIERINLSESSFLVEMKAAWELQDKQFYVGFVPNRKIPLNRLQTLPLFFPRDNHSENSGDFEKNENGSEFRMDSPDTGSLSESDTPYIALPSTQTKGLTPEQQVLGVSSEISSGVRSGESSVTGQGYGRGYGEGHYGFDDLLNLPLQIQDTKKKEKENFSEYKIYARKQYVFPTKSKNKISLKRGSLTKKPSFWLFNPFAKEQCQQIFFDLDELPLKLEESWEGSNLLDTKNGLIQTPNIFESLRPSSIFTKDYSGFSCNKKLSPNTIEKNGFLFFEKINQRVQLDPCNRLHLDLLNKQIFQRLVIDPVFLEAFYDFFSEGPRFFNWFRFHNIDPVLHLLNFFYLQKFEAEDSFLFYKTEEYSPGTPIHAKIFLFFTHLLNVHWLKEKEHIDKAIDDRPVRCDPLKELLDSSIDPYSCALSPTHDFFNISRFMLSNPKTSLISFYPSSTIDNAIDDRPVRCDPLKELLDSFIDPYSCALSPMHEFFNIPRFRLSNPKASLISSDASSTLPKPYRDLSTEQCDTVFTNIAKDVLNHMHIVRFSFKDKGKAIWVSQKKEKYFDNRYSWKRWTLSKRLKMVSYSKAFSKIEAFSLDNTSVPLSRRHIKRLGRRVALESRHFFDSVMPQVSFWELFWDILRVRENKRYLQIPPIAREITARYKNSYYDDVDAFCLFPLYSPPPGNYLHWLYDHIDELSYLMETRFSRLAGVEKRKALEIDLILEKIWKDGFYRDPYFSHNDEVLYNLFNPELFSDLSNMKSGEKEKTYVAESYRSILLSGTPFRKKVSLLYNKSFESDLVQKIKFYFLLLIRKFLDDVRVVSKERIKVTPDLLQMTQSLLPDYVLDTESFVSEEQLKNIYDLVQKSLILNVEKNNLLAKFVSSIKYFFTFNVKKYFFNEIPKLFKTKKKPKPSALLISRTLSGYSFPDTDIRTLRFFRLENIRKKLLFQKQKKEILSMNIEVPRLGVGPLASNLVHKKDLFTRNQRPTDNINYQPVLDNLAAANRISQILEPDVLVDCVFRYQLPTYEEFFYLAQFGEPKRGPESYSSIEERHSYSYIERVLKKYILSGSNIEGVGFYNQFVSLFVILWTYFLESLGDKVDEKMLDFIEYGEKITIYSYLVFLQYVLFSYLVKGFKTIMRWMIVKRKTYSNSRWAKRLGLSPNYIGYRLLENLETTMDDIAGIGRYSRAVDELIASLSKASLRLTLKNSIPKGYLLVGPPGTGKTFLVRAIAGESKTPIFIESGLGVVNRILVNTEDDSGARQVQDLFRKARQTTPCIVFIDEIDKFGTSRRNVMKSDVDTADFVHDFRQEFRHLGESSRKDYVDREFPGNITLLKSKSGLTGRDFKFDRSYADMVNRLESQLLSSIDSLAILAQFLVELDGMDSRTGIIVIGATNRFKGIDPALTRPGRLEHYLFINLPGKKSRIEIMKLYMQNQPIDFISSTKENKTGETEKSTSQDYVSGNKVFFKPKSQSSVPSNDISYSDISNTNKGDGTDTEFWEYLANLTVGFSAADLARAMNQSSIQAIYQKTDQTIETIEYGIESITSYSREKAGIISTKDPFFFTRFAYYQSGKAVLHTLLPQHPDPTVLKLWPRPRNNRHQTTADFIPIYTFSRAKLETRLIGFYAGKAGELCALSLNSQTKKQKTTNRIKENKATFRNILIKQKQPQENQTPSNQNHIWDSSLGVDDLLIASHLAHSLVEKWHFYSNKVSIRRGNQTLFNQNNIEIDENESGFSDYSRLRTVELIDKISASDISKNKKNLVQKGGVEQYVPELRDEETNIEIEEEKNSLESISFQIEYQHLSIIPWWEDVLTEEMAHYHISYKTWFRIYLPDHRQNEQNVEWVAPDKYYDTTYHFKKIWKNSYLLPTLKNLTYSKFLEKRLKKKKEPLKITDSTTLKVQNNPFDTLTTKKRYDKSTKIKESGVNQGEGVGREKRLDFDLTWNDLYKNDRDYIYHALVLTCFNKAFSLLDENRELFDYLADYLLRFEILRRHEIKKIVSDFGCSYPPNKDLTKTTDTTVTESPVMGEEVEKKNEKNFSKEEKQKINFIFEKKWGKNSRRPFSRFFSYDKFSLEFFSEIQKK